MPLDLSDDYLTVDLEEPVTLVWRATAHATHNEELEVSHSFWGPLTHKELGATAGCAVRMESAVDIPKKLLGAYTFKPGDQMVNQDDDTYNIYSVSRDAGTAFWRFLVYNPKIAYDLRHSIDVYDLQMEKDAAGAAYVGSEVLIYSAVSCRVQWQSERPGTYADRTDVEREGVIYSSQRLYLPQNALIRWTDPDTNIPYELDYLESHMSDRLDELQQIRVVHRP